MNINGAIDTSLSVGVSDAPAKISSLTPSMASPVLKGILTLSVTGYS